MKPDVKLSGESYRELNRAIRRLMDVSGDTTVEVLKSQGRLMCVDLAGITRPTGTKASIGTEQKARIKTKVEEVYWNMGEAVNALKQAGGDKAAAAFQRLVRQGKMSQAAAIMSRLISGTQWEVGTFDNGTLHKQQAFKRRVSRRMVVTDKGALTRYRSEKQKMAGFAKSGFATAAKQLGGSRGIPGYATKHNGPGTGKVSKSGNSITLTITNSVRHIHEAFDSSRESAAVNMRVGKITQLIKRIATNRMKKSSKSIK